VFSFFFGPETPLQMQSMPNTVVSAIILAVVAYLLLHKNPWGWYIVALEILLGGAGGFLSVGPIALRTCLLLVSMAIFDIQKALAGEYIKKLRNNLPYTLIITTLYIVVGISAIHGYYLGHDPRAIFADTIPYLFFLYFYPLRELWAQNNFKQILWNGLLAGICGNALFILITLIGFSSHLLVLQDSYYHWYRDVALGKITIAGTDFYRLVLNEHLLLIPTLLYFLWLTINQKILKYYSIIILVLLFILSLNLTRIYMLGLAVGCLFLFQRNNWKRWLGVCVGTALSFILIFTATHLVSTRGQSLGWEIFGLRLQSIVQPQMEDSALSRMLLLPKILEKIKSHPLLGNGLADTVAVYSPVLKQEVITPHFDWGYLEILAELGIIGLLTWGALLIYYFILLKGLDGQKQAFLAIGAGLVIANITSPVLFHGLGVILITAIITYNKNFTHLT